MTIGISASFFWSIIGDFCLHSLKKITFIYTCDILSHHLRSFSLLSRDVCLLSWVLPLQQIFANNRIFSRPAIEALFNLTSQYVLPTLKRLAR